MSRVAGVDAADPDAAACAVHGLPQWVRGAWGPGIEYFAAHKGAAHTHTLGLHGWERWSEWSEPLVTVNRGEAQAELAR